MSALAEDRTPERRVSGADEAYLLAEDLLGLRAPIQYLWVFDDDPGEEAIADLTRALAAGTLHRAVVRTRVPAARHRWVRSAVPPEAIASDPRASNSQAADDCTVDAHGIGAWFDDRLRRSAVHPVDGAGWRLDSAPTATGGRLVSLLVSHMIADGQAGYRAVAHALAGGDADLPSATSATGTGALLADLRDSRAQLAAAVRSLRIVVAQAWGQRGAHSGSGGSTAAVSDSKAVPDPAKRPDPTVVPEPTLATVDVDRGQWGDCARQHGGTPGSLFTALLAGIIERSDYPQPAETRVCIAVSRRGDDTDDRANASGGVWIRVPRGLEPGADLGDIRARSKAAFIDYAESGAGSAADNLQPIARLLPRPILRTMMRSVPGPDATVSSLGVLPDDVLTIGGITASSTAIRAITQGHPVDVRRRQGPPLAAWMVEYADRITLTFFGINPDHFGDEREVRELISAELASWGLSHHFW